MSLPLDWWERISRMARPALITTLVEEAERTADLNQKLEKAKDETKTAKLAAAKAELDLADMKYAKSVKVFIAAGRLSASEASQRMGITSSTALISTNDHYSTDTLRGYKLEPTQVYLVPGWTKGRYLEQVVLNLKICGVDPYRCAYAPSPEQDRMEHPDMRWGRTMDPPRPSYDPYFPKDDFGRDDYVYYQDPYLTPNITFDWWEPKKESLSLKKLADEVLDKKKP